MMVVYVRLMVGPKSSHAFGKPLKGGVGGLFFAVGTIAESSAKSFFLGRTWRPLVLALSRGGLTILPSDRAEEDALLG